MPRRPSSLVFTIPGADPILNERLRRIAEEIDKVSAPATTVTTEPTSGGVLDSGFEARVAGALKIVDGVISVKGQGITTELIKTFAVSAAKLAAAAVETDKIKNGAVTTTKIQNAAITNALIGNAAISAANIQDAAITTAKIQNGAITNALIAFAAITNAKIGDLEVSSAKIASLAANKISAGTVTAVNLVGGTLVLTLNGASLNIDNAFAYNGVETAPSVRMADNATGQRSMMTPLGFTVSSANGGAPGVYMSWSTFSSDGHVGVYNSLGGLPSITMNGGLAGAGGNLQVELSKVVGKRQTGWGTPSGTLTRSTYNDGTVTLQQLAQRLSALIVDLRSHGMIGN